MAKYPESTTAAATAARLRKTPTVGSGYSRAALPTYPRSHQTLDRRKNGRVILTADDFGRCGEVNRAILRAYRRGMLTRASLMVTGEAAGEAAALARRMPGLAVGLHVVLADGVPALPPKAIPHLVGPGGRFPRSPLRAGIRYAMLGRQGRDELRRELAAQFERFAATGLPLAHVDGHCHLHVHPAVFPELVSLAERYGARAVRLPRDDLLLALRHDPRRALRQAVWALALALLCRWAAGRLRRSRLIAAERSYGLLESGHMRPPYVVDLLGRIHGGTVEVYFHPTLGPRLDPLGPNPGDLATLLSPGVRAALHRARRRLGNRADRDRPAGKPP